METCTFIGGVTKMWKRMTDEEFEARMRTYCERRDWKDEDLLMEEGRRNGYSYDGMSYDGALQMIKQQLKLRKDEEWAKEKWEKRVQYVDLVLRLATSDNNMIAMIAGTVYDINRELDSIKELLCKLVDGRVSVSVRII
jgi:hypothetical protein